MQSEAFSEPVFQKQGKLVTFFRGFVLPRTLIGKSRRKRVFQVDLAEHLFSVGIYGNNLPFFEKYFVTCSSAINLALFTNF